MPTLKLQQGGLHLDLVGHFVTCTQTTNASTYNYVVVNSYFQLNLSFPLLLCMLMYGNVQRNKGKLKINCNIYLPFWT